jgi:hypothetical protein
MHRSNQLGLRAKCSRKKSNHCSRAFQHPSFDHGLEFRAGTQAGFVRATAHIGGIGWRLRNLSAFREAGNAPAAMERFCVPRLPIPNSLDALIRLIAVIYHESRYAVND